MAAMREPQPAPAGGPSPDGQAVARAEPTIRIRPLSPWTLGLRELWAGRELGYFLVWRDIKVRYKQTAIGALWAVIQPLMLMVVFTAFLGRVSGIAPAGIPYPVFTFSALVPWTLFGGAVTGASNSLVYNSNLIQKIYFPRLLLPAAAVGSFLVDFAIASVVLLAMILVFGLPLGPQVLLAPVFAALGVVTSLAVGVWLAAVNVRYRDVRYAVPFLVQVWFFATPVIYAGSTIPSQWQWLYSLNPMVGVIEGFRWSLLGGTPPSALALLPSTVGVLAVLVAGVLYFRHTESTFADII
jgi:lipopolysaccharide transport system permease protein